MANRPKTRHAKPPGRRQRKERYSSLKPLNAKERKWVEQNIGLIKTVALKYSKHHPDRFNALVNEGFLGCVRGLRNYDPKKAAKSGTKISSYVYYWIESAVRRAAISDFSTVRLSEEASYNLFRLQKVQADLMQKLQRSPTVGEIAKKMGIPTAKAGAIMKLEHKILSLQEPLERGPKSASAEDSFEKFFGEPPKIGQFLYSGEEVMQLVKLSPRQKIVFRGRFGSPRKTLQEVGNELGGITRERVRQMEEEIIERLKKALPKLAKMK